MKSSKIQIIMNNFIIVILVWQPKVVSIKTKYSVRKKYQALVRIREVMVTLIDIHIILVADKWNYGGFRVCGLRLGRKVQWKRSATFNISAPQHLLIVVLIKVDRTAQKHRLADSNCDHEGTRSQSMAPCQTFSFHKFCDRNGQVRKKFIVNYMCGLWMTCDTWMCEKDRNL